MGGRIAWTFASQHPERTDKLVLISPDGFASPGMKYGVAPKVPLMMRALPYALPTSMLRASLVPAYANAAIITDALFARYRDMMLAPGVRSAILRRMGQQRLVDPIPMLRRIAVPTLVMWGRKGWHDSFFERGRLHERITRRQACGFARSWAHPTGGSAGHHRDCASVPA